MARRRKKPMKSRAARLSDNPIRKGLRGVYERACQLAEKGDRDGARRLYETVGHRASDARLKALVRNDLAVLAASAGDTHAARNGFQEALALYGECEAARVNLALVEAEAAPLPLKTDGAEPTASPVLTPSATRVAVLSFLFNWPSTGGGTVHTFELAKFLARAGYEVKHIYARYPAWRVGGVEGTLPYPSEMLSFDINSWNVRDIQARFRQAVEGFGPDHVIITDSWNMKPLLAEAVRGFPYVLRFQAMECFCPLNNVRLLADEGGRVRQCQLHQLATPQECARCLDQRGTLSGSLHQAERALAGVGSTEYHDRLVRAFREAEAVLVVNPLHEAMVSPYTSCVRVVTSGIDPARFPWPSPQEAPAQPPKKRSILFAGLVEEWMKGFGVLHEACARLWRRRQDFELVATGDPPGQVDPFTRFVGWQSQEELPRHLRAADMVAVPTIAQEALGRTAVEAMAAGRPVVASRLGGLPFTVADGATGLLCEPGDPDDLARKLETLLDDPELRQRLGQAGRRRFEEHYSWEVVIERHYKPLLGRPAQMAR